MSDDEFSDVESEHSNESNDHFHEYDEADSDVEYDYNTDDSDNYYISDDDDYSSYDEQEDYDSVCDPDDCNSDSNCFNCICTCKAVVRYKVGRLIENEYDYEGDIVCGEVASAPPRITPSVSYDCTDVTLTTATTS